MSFNFLNLDDETRKLMLSEVERDEKTGTVYTSTRFTTEGITAYSSLLKESITRGTETSLAESLNKPQFFKSTETSTTKTGASYTKGVSDIAYLTFAEGEFNKYYMRALSLRAISENRNLEIYRAKEVENHQPDSDAKIGESINADDFLKDLQELQVNNFTYPASGWSRKPNSGLSVKLT